MPFKLYTLYDIRKCSKRKLDTTFSKKKEKQNEPAVAIGLRPSEIVTYLN
jgi:hypothetical protein